MSEDFMKSALERAMERADRIEVPEEKLKEMKYRSEGERIAAEFLKNPEYDIGKDLDSLAPETKKYVNKTVASVFLKNVVLPKKDSDIAGNNKAFEGLSILKKDKKALQQAKEQLDNLSNYYMQARKQNFEQLKTEVERLMSKTIQQKTGASAGMKMNVEQTAEFQENWRQLSGKLDRDYDKALAQLKEQIVSIA